VSAADRLTLDERVERVLRDAGWVDVDPPVVTDSDDGQRHSRQSRQSRQSSNPGASGTTGTTGADGVTDSDKRQVRQGDRRGLQYVTCATVKATPLDWLWRGYMPLGKILIFDGDPGISKSTVLVDIAARISTGSPMPDGAAVDGPADVVILSAEDSVSDTIRPRLDAAAGDPARVHVVTEVIDPDNNRPRPVDLVDDLDDIAGVVRKHGAKLLIVDPLMAFLGTGVDSHRDQDVRRILHRLAVMAEQCRCTIAVIRHLNKTGGTHAVYRGGGSIGIIGAARAGFLIGLDPENDQRRVLAPTKMNVAVLPPALGYQLVPDELRGVARVQWEGPVDRKASDLLVAPSEATGDRLPRDEAKDWLADLLADGPVLAVDVQRYARNNNISKRTLERAKGELPVRSRRQGFGRESRVLWALSDADGHTSPPTPIHRHPADVATNGKSGDLWDGETP